MRCCMLLHLLHVKASARTNVQNMHEVHLSMYRLNCYAMSSQSELECLLIVTIFVGTADV